MQWLDEVAGVVAMRHAETHRVVTAAVDNLQFKQAIYEGEILVLRGYVTYVGKSSMEVEIDTYTELPDEKSADIQANILSVSRSEYNSHTPSSPQKRKTAPVSLPPVNYSHPGSPPLVTEWKSDRSPAVLPRIPV